MFDSGTFDVASLAANANFRIFDFELDAEHMRAIAALGSKTSAFFDYRDPHRVKWSSERKIHD